MSIEVDRAQIPEPRNGGLAQRTSPNRREQSHELVQMYSNLAHFALLAGDVQARHDYIQMAQIFEQKAQ